MQAKHKAHGINDEMQNNFPLLDHHFEFRPITQQFKKSPAPASLQALQGLNMQTMSAMAAHLPEGTLSSPQTEALRDRRQQALREAGLDGHNSPNSSTAAANTPDQDNTRPDGSVEKTLVLSGALDLSCDALSPAAIVWLLLLIAGHWHLQPRALSQALQCVKSKVARFME